MPATITRADCKRLDRLAMQYLTALAAGDFDAIGEMWALAQTDAAVGDMLHELNAEYVTQTEERP